ncbi:MAG: transketolase [Proteobacteria bacterium]|nr:transketolase [Pseudomonadota bacterium]
MRELMYVQAINEALAEEMRRDEKVFVVGESIQGGSFGATTGLVQEFGPDRILDSPICETGVAGAGLGAAMAGYRPVVDFMFADFMYVAGDEIFLKAAQWRFLHGGKVDLPLVFMGAVGGGMMLCNEHSQVPSAPVLHSPGLKLALPSTPHDAKGLLKTAIRDNNPVCFFWHKMLLGLTGDVPEEDYTVPFGVAEVRKPGSDVTLVANSLMVHYALQVARELEGRISVEVIDPRTLEPLDLETILESVAKTGRVVIADEDTERCGFAAELGFQIMEHAFDSLDAPVKRVCAANYPIPGGYIEQHVLPNAAKIKAAVEQVVR